MIDERKIRAWWFHRQALDGTLMDKPASKILERTGWARSVGGANPYLALFARGVRSREAIDRELADKEIHELPSARGCTYVVPASDFALALKAGAVFTANSDLKTALKLGVTEREIEKLCDAVLDALKKGPLDPEQIRESSAGAVRNLGAAGKKKGLTSTLPVVLGKLQCSGEIRRIPVNGRVDQQRYRYDLWRPNPLAACRMSREEACTELARKYFSWIGPATLAQFQWFSGLGVKAAKDAVGPLKLEPLQDGDERLIPTSGRAQLQSFKPPGQPHFALVGSLDGITHLRRSLKELLEPEDLKKEAFSDTRPREIGGLTDLSSHAILDRGRLVGLWEYDVETESIVWTAFIPGSKDLEAAVQEMEEFIRTDLGDARSFSLDSPKSRAPRIKALREARRAQRPD